MWWEKVEEGRAAASRLGLLYIYIFNKNTDIYAIFHKLRIPKTLIFLHSGDVKKMQMQICNVCQNCTINVIVGSIFYFNGKNCPS